MSISGYQIELLLNDFRKRYGYKRVPTHKFDALEISEEAQYEAQRIQPYISQKPLSAVGLPGQQPSQIPQPSEWVSPEKILNLVADQTKYDPIVEYEQQRRAGLFVNPIYSPPNPPPSINKVYDYVGAAEGRPKEAQAHQQTEGRPDEAERLEPVPDKEGHHSELSGHTEGSPDKLKPASSATQKNKGLGVTIDEEEFDDLEFTEEESREDEESNVVYGMGHITREATTEFVHQHTDSAIKFISRRDLDGKLLPVPVQGVHEEWSQRGLSRRRILNYILEIMEWEKLPDDTLMEIWSSVRDQIYDVMHG